ncbi:MAG: ATP synthase gamma chain (EC [uncultured Campylobacterales bacterium]|uniref:ATP synthase gamma chain n=1 Tax=uncultured Campylobacterales bacterium TaxID=352960 RepID=A0A6S6S7N5_9BACT|nr:MAG: ATP synthase gamma chain (EC [uncultured Campylobacterales bacterium]
MANLKDIKRQIKSVQNTEKTTKAMKLVSTAKLRLAELAAKEASAYARKISEVLSEISYEYSANNLQSSEIKFFNHSQEVKTIDIICVTADKGLCGGFNAQTLKTTTELLELHKDKNVRLTVIGKKGRDYFKFKGVPIFKEYINVSSTPNYKVAKEIIDVAMKDFISDETHRVILVSNGYKNMISQQIKVVELLPVTPLEIENKSLSLIETEPEDSKVIFEELTGKYVEYNMYYALIDSLAAEHSARMQAMDTATKNAGERVDALTLSYNKARQEVITTELIEIISGVESLK